MKKKVLLINTPKREFDNDDQTTELGIDNSYPIGLLTICSQLKRFSMELNLSIDYLDANFYHFSVEEVVKEAVAFDFIGMNVTFPSLGVVTKIAERIKSLNPDARIIIGGPAATLAPDYLLENSDTDYVVIGEGEITIVELLARLVRDLRVDDVKGIAYLENDDVVFTEKREKMDINTVPVIDISNIPIEIRRNSNEINIVSSRGCSFNCSFCSTPAIWGKGRRNLRCQKPKRIIEEILAYKNSDFSFERVHFLDDNFTANKENLKGFISEWNKHNLGKLGLTWRCLGRIDELSHYQILQEMKTNGCTKISIGIETVTPRILREIGKGLTLEKLENFLAMTYSLGVYTKGFAMIGFPNETEEEAKGTLQYLAGSKLSQVAVNIVMAYPGTRLHKQVYGDKDRVIPKFNFLGENGVKELDKYSSTPATSLSQHITIERLYELKEYGFKLFAQR